MHQITNHRDTETQRLIRFLWVSVTLWLVIGVPVPSAAQGGAWESAIAAFEASDRTSPPPTGEIVFVGS